MTYEDTTVNFSRRFSVRNFGKPRNIAIALVVAGVVGVAAVVIKKKVIDKR
jgi:hypothetical protein